ncbi:MAG: amino acid deaminase/aldolase [Flavobacteriales bacterium]|nr:amino acid deaminase/aldolase [Flavobacteriales bacterium]
MQRDYFYYKNILAGKSMPLAFVDLDLFDQNIQEVLRRVGNLPIRVASKSLRCLPLLQRIIQADSRFQGIMAYHPLEAVKLSQAGLDDILLGYPCFHEQHIQAVLEEVKRGKKIIFMVDEESHLLRIDKLAKKLDVLTKICFDVDMSTNFPGLHFGVWRSPLHTVQDVMKLTEVLKRCSNLALEGIMGYEAQIAGLGDNVAGNGIKNKIIKWLKKKSIKDIITRRGAIVKALEEEGIKINLVNAGGTGSIESSILEPWVTEVTVGSAFYAPALFDYYTTFRHQPAAAFALEITRIPSPGIYTCQGGGYIASGEVGVIKQPVPYLPEGIKTISTEGFGEVQTPIRYNGKVSLQVGDPLFFRHAKAGELMERFNKIYFIKEGKIVDEELTYRGMGWCFG